MYSSVATLGAQLFLITSAGTGTANDGIREGERGRRRGDEERGGGKNDDDGYDSDDTQRMEVMAFLFVFLIFLSYFFFHAFLFKFSNFIYFLSSSVLLFREGIG